MRHTAFFLLRHWKVLRRNRRLHDVHRGERCFILCNGPSVLKQDLLPLRNEVVFSVASGYLHANYERIGPRYHVVPPITYGMITEDDVVRWFREMDERIGSATLFLGSGEYCLVAKHGLFARREIHYLCCARPFLGFERGIVGLAGPMPAPASVSILGLLAALYMGFADLYLVGTDHDSFATGQYRYAFEPTVMRGKDFAVNEAGAIRTPLHDELVANLALWRQYRLVKRIALLNGRSIRNATAGGLLDEFPRVTLEEALQSPRPTLPPAT